MVDDSQLRSRGDRSEYTIGDLRLALDREWDPGHHDFGPGPLGGEAENLAHRVVVVGRGEQLVAGLEQCLERPKDRCDSGGGIPHRDQADGVGAHEFADGVPGAIHGGLQLPPHETAGICLEPPSPNRLKVEHLVQHRAKRAVVEMTGAQVKSPHGSEP